MSKPTAQPAPDTDTCYVCGAVRPLAEMHFISSDHEDAEVCWDCEADFHGEPSAESEPTHD